MSSSSSSGNVDYSVLSSAWDSLLERASTWGRRKVTVVVVACFLVVVVVGLLSAQVHHLGSLDARLRRFEEAVEEAVELQQLAEAAAANESEPETQPGPWKRDLGGGCRFTSVGHDCRLALVAGGGNLKRRSTEDTFGSCRKWCAAQAADNGECIHNFRSRECYWRAGAKCTSGMEPLAPFEALALTPGCLRSPACDLANTRCLGKVVEVEQFAVSSPGDCSVRCGMHNHWVEERGKGLGWRCEWFAHNRKTGECRLLSTCPGVAKSGSDGWTSSESSCEYDLN